jgi:hypothetical protein
MYVLYRQPIIPVQLVIHYVEIKVIVCPARDWLR